ncbi:hypothetical protein QBC46DRAFT_305368 [Diplogelasinospora grovesii]|uniref:Mitochondrial group I intron splicing factor CCM1 n=1 Tax=Diplogelasinospora grovesii TaxID=303347 RepID=A0AAN6NEC3_9PEZI|nr:hypothetical protein QBC46DRAFT_305368 [Diplogelasinospora grovesii]
MFVCRACLRRTLGPRPLYPLRAATSFASSRRGYATAVTDLQTAEAKDSEDAPELSPAQNRRLEWVVKKHLEYLKDPYKIQEHVKRTLDKGAFDEAALLTRKASRDAKVTVSWNHLIDYQMRNQRLHAAMKLYNEMKKRAQLPDAKTYTIIFRGCAESMHPKLAVSEAVKIYTSMLTSERLKPNTIHMNAVLDTCARAGDLDTMFSIVKTADARLRAPNNQTYTIILNALRHKPDFNRRSGLEEVEVERMKQLNIERAKSIWEEVVQKWKKAQLVIDEQLVCAMGRVLTSGNKADNNMVLDLLEQTMKLPRFDKTDSSKSLPTASNPPDNARPTDVESFRKETSRLVESGGVRTHATPGNNTLSLLMISLTSTKKTSLAHRYWDYLTGVYRVTPDKDNYYRYLKCLQVGKASTRMAEVIRQMPHDFLNSVTFRMGFSTCIGDNLNQHAFSNACRIFDVMAEHLRYPDALAMRLFLQSARGNTRQYAEQKDSDPQGSKYALGKQIISAVDRMWPSFRILMNSFSYPAHDKESTKSPEEKFEKEQGDKQEAMTTARRMVAAMDKVVTENMLADQTVMNIIRTRRNILNRLVERNTEKNWEMQEKMGKARPAQGKGRVNIGDVLDQERV